MTILLAARFGVNFLTAFVEVGGMHLPCAVELIGKSEWEAGPIIYLKNNSIIIYLNSK